MNRNRVKLAVLSIITLFSLFVRPEIAFTAPLANDLRISQVYGGGGNSGATYTNDFIEIFNAGASAIDVTGYSVQYASSAGTTWQVTNLSGSIEPGEYYLVQQAAGAGGTTPLPTPDATGTIPMSATNGKVALVSSTTALSGACPGGWVDQVGFGSADCFEGSAATPALSNTTAALRDLNGCEDTDDNAANFATGAPNPRNSASPTNSCAVDNPPTVNSTSPADNEIGVALDAAVTVTFSEAVTLDTGWYTLDCTLSGGHLGTTSGGPTSYILTPTVGYAFDDVCTFTVVANQVADQDGTPDNMLADHVFSFTAVSDEPPSLVVNEIDYDQAGTDTAEFIEIKNTGVVSTSLDGVSLVLVNGSGGGASVYATYLLPDVDLAAGDYFVVCANAANTANCDMDVLPDTNMIQNGDPDAVSLWLGSTLLDTVSYGGNTGAPYTEGSGVGLDDNASVDDFGLSRCADGVDTDQNNVDFIFAAISPGKANCLPPLVINEIDYDQPGTDTAEYVEIKNTGTVSVSLNGISLVLVNGSGSVVYDTIALPDVMLAAGDYYVVCANAATVANCDLDDTPDTNWLQNGAPDAVALYSGADLLDVVSYEGDTAGYTEGSGVGLIDDGVGTLESISRCPDGVDTDQNNLDFILTGGTPGEANDCAPATACTGTPVLISAVQGSGSSSPLAGSMVEVQAIVTGDYQGSTGLNGFFIQEEDADADADPMTSEGLFVFDGSFGIDVSVGDLVQVGGTVVEFFNLTEITSVTCLNVISSGNPLPTAATVMLPVTNISDFERYEGMLVTFNQELTVTDNFTWGRFGEVTLSANGRLFNPTHVASPGAPALAVADLNARSQIQLDDGSTVQNPLPLPPYIGADDTLRSGDTIPSLTGVLGYAFGVYEVHPVGAISFTRANDRPAAPDPVGGTLQVAAFNVLNYFSTIDDGVNDICGPLANQECRGADSATEFTRQHDKIVSALLAMDADVVGLMELENDAANVALSTLVDGLNAVAGAGTYDYIATGPIGSDAIRVALIYKPATVSPSGSFAILDTSVDPTFNDTLNRPVLAQTFMENSSGELFTVAVNHLKSKGSACPGDPDTGDGQGNCNLTRTAAAIALANWLATDPTGSGDPDTLIIGDLNSYAMEDPIVALEGLGYTDLIEAYHGAGGYSYVFFGAAGYLDYVMANTSMLAQVTGATSWHINADEPIALDYNNEFNQPLLYSPDAYRASDHDPVIVGLALGPELDLSMDDGGVSITFGTTVAYTLSFTNTGTLTATNVVLTATVPTGSMFDASANPSGWSCTDGSVPGTDCIYSAGDLAPGSSGAVVFAVRPPASQGGTPFVISASASIGDDEGDSDTAGDTTPVENAVVHVEQIWMIDRSTFRAYVVNMVFKIVNQFGVGVDGIRLEAEITAQPDGKTGFYLQRTGHGGFTSNFSRSMNPGTFTVCAVNIFGPGVTYDSGANVETCDSISLPLFGPQLGLPAWME